MAQPDPKQLPLTHSGDVCLRRLSPEDCAAFQAYRQDPEISRFQSWEQMTDEQAKGFLSHVQAMTPLLQPGQWTQIAVARTSSNELMGDMGLFLSEDEQEAELGITLARAFHRQGIATQAMMLAMKYVFDQTSIQRVICGADQNNTASLGMIKKLGFQYTHDETTPGKAGAKNIIDAMFAMSRSDWKNRSS